MTETNISTTKTCYSVIVNDKGLLFDSRQKKCYDGKINAQSMPLAFFFDLEFSTYISLEIKACLCVHTL